MNFIFLTIFLKKDFMKKESFISKTFFQSLSASFIVGGVAYLSLSFLSPVFGTNTFWGVFLQGFIAGIAGVICGIIVLYLLKNQELKDLFMLFKTKFWNNKVMPPTEETL